jgi:hypothetical protein
VSKSCTNVIRPSETVNTETKCASLSTRTPQEDLSGRCPVRSKEMWIRLDPRPEQFEDILSAVARPIWIDRDPANMPPRRARPDAEVASIVCVHRPGDDRECAQGVHKLDGAQPERRVNPSSGLQGAFREEDIPERRMRTPSVPCGRESVVDLPPVTVLFATGLLELPSSRIHTGPWRVGTK